MIVHDLKCTKCDHIELEFYHNSDLDLAAMKCPACGEDESMSFHHSTGMTIGYNVQRKDLSTVTPNSFKEVLKTIAKGVAPGKLGESMNKYT